MLPVKLQTQLVSTIFAALVWSGNIIGLKMLNLDVPNLAFQGDTIRLSCAFTLDSNNSPASDHRRAFPAFARRLEGDVAERVYSVKWYKDEREFFRFIDDSPKKQFFPARGIVVDVSFASLARASPPPPRANPDFGAQVDESDIQTIVLRNVSLKTTGLFKCEVSTDAPHFITKSIERKLDVYCKFTMPRVRALSSCFN